MLKVGDKVRNKNWAYEHYGVVIRCCDTPGADGRFWVGVNITTIGFASIWHVHLERQDLELVG